MRGKGYLPFVLIGLWFSLNYLLGGGRKWAPGVIGTMWGQRTGLVVSALLLTGAILMSLRRLAAGRGGAPAVIASVVAALLFVGETSMFLYSSAAETDVVFLSDYGTTLQRLERLGQGALTGKNPKGRRFVAKWTFISTGLTVPYLTESGATKVFDPSAAEIAERDDRRTTDREMNQSYSVFSAQAQQLRWGAHCYLAVAALVLLPGMFWIVLARRRSLRAAPAPAQQSAVAGEATIDFGA